MDNRRRQICYFIGAILGGVLGAFLIIHFFLIPYYEIEPPDKYDIFSELLFIFLAISGFGMFAFYHLYQDLRERLYKELGEELREGIERGQQQIMQDAENIREQAEEDRIFFISRFAYTSSVVYWRHYEAVGEGTPLYRTYLDYTIKEAKNALDYAEKLKDKSARKRYICDCKNNLAYHLAVRGDRKDKRNAHKLAKYVYDKAADYEKEFHWKEFHWIETYAWVLMRFAVRNTAEGQEEFETGLQIIKRLLTDEDIDSDDSTWRQRTRERYEAKFQIKL
ncbi:MAG TPA: hypothetical protein EYP79_01750 [Campylobacterales bacterium]|nr:hypothetical protein [Campylobacterales bacterium]